MPRVRLLLAMAALSAMLVLTVRYGSPYAPVVAPCPEDIETIWAIEDARQKSDTPLVTAMQYGDRPLAYDAQSNTFYCTLGLRQGDAWPDICLTAQNVRGGVKLLFLDDYAYDGCAEAVQNGYGYQILAYTDEAYSYTQVIFTGLPLVMLTYEGELGDLDTPMEIAVSSFDHKSVVSMGNVHLRGNGSKHVEKKNLKVEFTRSADERRNTVDLLSFGLMDEILLNPMAFDEMLIRDRLSWTVYGEMLGSDYAGGFGARKTEYAEVFLNNEYYGVYLLMEPMDEADELLREGVSHPLTDSVYRTLPGGFVEPHRPALKKPGEDGSVFELRYEPTQIARFSAMKPYVDLLEEKDEETFIRKAESCMDIESVVRYALLTQAAGLTDNASNNVYIWARHDADGMRYRFAPWDMDMSWGSAWGDITQKLGEAYDGWRAFDMVDKLIALDVNGAVELMIGRWRQWRQTIFTTEHIMGLLNQYFNELSASGALARNAERWDLEMDTEGYKILEYTEMRFAALDQAMDIAEKREGRTPPFLKDYAVDLNCYPMLNE